jgi:hypothetical protein
MSSTDSFTLSRTIPTYNMLLGSTQFGKSSFFESVKLYANPSYKVDTATSLAIKTSMVERCSTKPTAYGGRAGGFCKQRSNEHPWGLWPVEMYGDGLAAIWLSTAFAPFLHSFFSWSLLTNLVACMSLLTSHTLLPKIVV